MQCTMCGYEFEPGHLTCHPSCPLGATCLVICCPRCGYSMVDPARSRLSRWMQRLLHPGDAPGPAPTPGGPGVPLLALEPGQEGQVLSMDDDRSERLEHLGQFGLTPGATIRLVQKRPVPVVQVGGTDLALDLPVAQAIYIERPSPWP